MLNRFVFLIAVVLLGTACGEPEPERLVIYSGRSKSLVDPLIQQFSEASGLQVDVRYGDTAQLAVALLEEGDRSPADLFWAQDAGALGAVHAAGLFGALSDPLIERIPPAFRGSAQSWVGTSGRARTLAWSTDRVDESELPTSILDLASPDYADRVGWAPTNGSFQASVTAMRRILGTEATKEWLTALKENGAVAYSNNRGILEGIAAGEIDLGLPNHYYLYRYTATDPDYPVAQGFFADGDPGNLINVAGVGILASSNSWERASEFVSFLLDPEAQAYFASENFEYPVVSGTATPDVLGEAARIADIPPVLNLDDLEDLDTTLSLLRDVGLL